MAIKISVITTANRTRCFKVDNPENITYLIDGLKRSANIFSGKPLIIGSESQTTIFSAASIACIELETDLDIFRELPGKHEVTITALTTEEAIAPFEGGIDGNTFSARIDFHFLGGHVINALIAGASCANAATFTVTTLADNGAGSLRDAIAKANQATGADAIAFQAGLTGTITLTGGDLAITDSLTLTGPGRNAQVKREPGARCTATSMPGLPRNGKRVWVYQAAPEAWQPLQVRCGVVQGNARAACGKAMHQNLRVRIPACCCGCCRIRVVAA